MKQVYAAPNPTEAHLVAGLLEQEGIPSAVRGDALFTTVDGGMQFHETATLLDNVAIEEEP